VLRRVGGHPESGVEVAKTYVTHSNAHLHMMRKKRRRRKKKTKTMTMKMTAVAATRKRWKKPAHRCCGG
jgi:hypothetical protein